jgi:prepilin-type N-terminal cleavage/methylation domain-containing protein
MKINKKLKLNRGMTYVELIVVLSIFSVLSSVAVFNYRAFQSRVDIKNLASDITLKIVEAQKASLSGLLPQSSVTSSWKPSYGVYFDISTPKQFIYFVDLDNQGTRETLETINITKDNSISSLGVCYQGSLDPCSLTSLSDLFLTFSRPNSGAIITSSSSFTSNINYVQITVTSPQGASSLIKLYPSGRVQIN